MTKAMFRVLAALALIIVLAVLTVRQFQAPLGMALAERRIADNFNVDPMSELGEGFHAGLCGTGTPFPDQQRAGPCLFVVAGDQFFVIDSGGGSTETLLQMGMPVGEIDGLLLTHFHSDHIADMGELMLQRWVGASNTSPLPVYGPRGVRTVVDGFNLAFSLDFTYRVAHHGPEVVPPSGAGAVVALEVEDFDADGTRVIHDAEGLRITMFRVDHSPVEPTVGYRFDYGGRAVVISGDTSYEPQVVVMAEGADVLFHDALSRPLVRLLEEAAAESGRDVVAEIMADIPDYHATPEEAARAAQEAGAQMLVLYHIVPPLPSRFIYPAYLGNAPAAFDGPIIMGEDGMVFSLALDGSDAIERRRF